MRRKNPTFRGIFAAGAWGISGWKNAKRGIRPIQALLLCKCTRRNPSLAAGHHICRPGHYNTLTVPEQVGESWGSSKQFPGAHRAPRTPWLRRRYPSTPIVARHMLRTAENAFQAILGFRFVTAQVDIHQFGEHTNWVPRRSAPRCSESRSRIDSVCPIVRVMR